MKVQSLDPATLTQVKPKRQLSEASLLADFDGPTQRKLNTNQTSGIMNMSIVLEGRRMLKSKTVPDPNKQDVYNKTPEEEMADMSVSVDLQNFIQVQEIIYPEKYDTYQPIPEICNFANDEIFAFLISRSDQTQTLHFIDLVDPSLPQSYKDRLHTFELTSSDQIIDVISPTIDKYNDPTAINEIIIRTFNGKKFTLKYDDIKNKKVTQLSIEEGPYKLNNGQLKRYQEDHYIGMNATEDGMVFVKYQDDQEPIISQQMLGSKILSFTSIALDYYGDHVLAIIRETGGLELYKGFSKVFDSDDLSHLDPLSIRGMVEHELRDLKENSFDDVILTADNLYIRNTEGEVHHYIIGRYVLDSQIFTKAPDSQKISQWELAKQSEIGLLFNCFSIQNSTLLFGFDSILIQIPIYHDETPKIKRVDRFQFEITDIINYDQNETGGMSLNFEYKKTGIHMLGLSKLNPKRFYDWDFIHSVKPEKQPIILPEEDKYNYEKLPSHTLIIFTDENYLRDEYNKIDEITLFKFKGTVTNKYTHKFDSTLHTVYLVKLKTGKFTVFNDKERLPKELDSFKNIFQKDQGIQMFMVSSFGEFKIGMFSAQSNDTIKLFQSEGYESHTFTNAKEAFNKIYDPIMIIQPEQSINQLIIILSSQIFIYDKDTHQMEEKIKNFYISRDSVQLVDHKYLYIKTGKTIECISIASILSATPGGISPLITVYENSYINHLKYFVEHQRFGVFKNTNTLFKIFPIAHQAKISFFGFNEITNYYKGSSIFSKIVKDGIFTGLNVNDRFVAWDITTCLPISIPDISEESLFQKLKNEGFHQFNETNIGTFIKGDIQLSLMQMHDYSRSDHVSTLKLIEFVTPLNQFEYGPGKTLFWFKLPIECDRERLFFDRHLKQMLHLQINQEKDEVKLATLYNITYDKNTENKIASLDITQTFTHMKWDCQYSKIENLISPNFKYYLNYSSESKTFEICHIDGSHSILLKYREDEDNLPQYYTFEAKKEMLNLTWITDFLILDRSSKSGLIRAYEIIENQQISTHLIYDFSQALNDVNFQFLMEDQVIEQLMQNIVSSEERKKDVKDKMYLKRMTQVDKLGVQRSWTLYHWMMTKKIISENDAKIVESLSSEDIQNLLMNQFRTKNYKNQTFLHLISLQEELTQSKGLTQVLNTAMLQKLFSKIQTSFHFPFLQNFKTQDKSRNCPISLLLQRNNTQAINVILQNLKNHPIAFHSKEIAQVLPQLILKPSIGRNLYEYLDSRIIESGQHLGQVNSLYNLEMDNFFPLTNREYFIKGIPQIHPWRQTLKQQVIDDQQLVIQNEIKVRAETLDLVLRPLNNLNDKQHIFNLYRAISNARDYETLNSRRSIQILIDHRWIIMKRYIIWTLFLPFVIQISAFITYSNVFNGQLNEGYRQHHPEEEKGFIALSIILYFFSSYFLLHELFQMLRSRLEYFTKSLIWNLLDVFPSVMIIAIVTTRFIDRYTDQSVADISSFINSVHSVASLLIWLKFFYFLRVFDSTSYLIRIIMGTLFDMKEFLMILFLVQIGFGEAFLRLSEASNEKFIQNFAEAFVFTFRMSLADNDTGPFEQIAQPITAWILFVLCGLFTNIVMLNLLISIIGQSFDRINQQATVTTFKERADLIHDNAYLMRWPFTIVNWFKISNTQSTKWLMILTDVSNEEETNGSQEALVNAKQIEIEGKIQNMERKMNQMEDLMKSNHDIVIKTLESIQEQIKK